MFFFSLAQNCFFQRGQDYLGIQNITVTNTPCLPWKNTKERSRVELLTHNFCRNPGDALERPWCYVISKDGRQYAEFCNIQSCGKIYLTKKLVSFQTETIKPMIMFTFRVRLILKCRPY